MKVILILCIVSLGGFWFGCGERKNSLSSNQPDLHASMFIPGPVHGDGVVPEIGHGFSTHKRKLIEKKCYDRGGKIEKPNNFGGVKRTENVTYSEILELYGSQAGNDRMPITAMKIPNVSRWNKRIGRPDYSRTEIFESDYLFGHDIFAGAVTGDAVVLTEDGKKVKKKLESYTDKALALREAFSECGDMYVVQVSLGPKYIASLTVESTSGKMADNIMRLINDAKKIPDYSLDLSEEAKIATERIREFTKISVNIDQLGGIPSELEKSLNAKSLTCNLDNIKACTDFYIKAVQYSGESFSDQIASNADGNYPRDRMVVLSAIAATVPRYVIDELVGFNASKILTDCSIISCQEDLQEINRILEHFDSAFFDAEAAIERAQRLVSNASLLKFDHDKVATLNSLIENALKIKDQAVLSSDACNYSPSKENCSKQKELFDQSIQKLKLDTNQLVVLPFDLISYCEIITSMPKGESPGDLWIKSIVSDEEIHTWPSFLQALGLPENATCARLEDKVKSRLEFDLIFDSGKDIRSMVPIQMLSSIGRLELDQQFFLGEKAIQVANQLGTVNDGNLLWPKVNSLFLKSFNPSYDALGYNPNLNELILLDAHIPDINYFAKSFASVKDLILNLVRVSSVDEDGRQSEFSRNSVLCELPQKMPNLKNLYVKSVGFDDAQWKQDCLDNVKFPDKRLKKITFNDIDGITKQDFDAWCNQVSDLCLWY